VTATSDADMQHVSLVDKYPNFDNVASPISFSVSVTLIPIKKKVSGGGKRESFVIRLTVIPCDDRMEEEVYHLVRLVRQISIKAHKKCCFHIDKLTLECLL